MNKTFNKLIKTNITLAVLSVFAVIIMIGGVSYALFFQKIESKSKAAFQIGNLEAGLSSSTGMIVLSDIFPTNASEIGNNNLYSFSITNNGDYPLDYTIYLSDNTAQYKAAHSEYSSYTTMSTSNYQYIDYKLDGGAVSNLSRIYNSSTKRMVLLTGTIAGGGTIENHTIQFWLDNGDTTTNGAPNSIAGSMLAVNINLEGVAKGVKQPTVAEKIKASVQTTKPDFANGTETGVYTMQDDYGTSYYLRGNITNNYVEFGDYIWRIVRINGDGSLRIIYDGTTPHMIGEGYTDRGLLGDSFNGSNDNNAYVGYMYGDPNGTTYDAVHANTNSSRIKSFLDRWYEINIRDKGLDGYVSDALFCNDRIIEPINTVALNTGIGTDETNYGAAGRFLESPPNPILTCPRKNDAFTVNDTTKGNGALTYPIGLLTADEYILAGGKYDTNSTNIYLYKKTYWWLGSPYGYNVNNGYGASTVYCVDSNGSLVNHETSDMSWYIVPVINLTAEYTNQLRGSGTMDDPYTA